MDKDEAMKQGIQRIASRLLETIKKEIDDEASEIEYRMKKLGLSCDDAPFVDEKLREIIGSSIRNEFDELLGCTMFLSQAVVAVWKEG